MPSPFQRQLAGICLCLILVLSTCPATAMSLPTDKTSAPEASLTGKDMEEYLFSKGKMEVGFAAGGGMGFRVLGTSVTHNFAMGSIYAGRMMSGKLLCGTWFEGNWEILAELFGGYQTNHSGAYVVGLTPFFRYNFAAGGRWVPFVEVGPGITLTNIYGPDLSTRFEFNLQAGTGFKYYFRKNLAATFEARYLHLSNAGMEYPNRGVNSMIFFLGVAWFPDMLN